MTDAVQMSNSEMSNSPQVLDFLWLELTNQCNLNCLHCYSESSPRSTEKNLLAESDYLSVLTQAHALGCRRVQFIGGEPTLNKSLASLIGYAGGIGFEFIEVFTNLVSLSDSLLETFIRHKVAVATSVYASEPGLHDLITQAPGSHKKTIANIQRVLNAGLQLRASIISMDENRNAIDATTELLRGLGVTNIGRDKVRGFGRAQADGSCSMGDLCGNCANNILAIGPDGVAAPCIMSKQWSVGSVLDTPLRQIAMSDSLYETRRRIADATAVNYDPCQPDASCMPNCGPSSNCLPCAPNAGQPCEPNRWCNPATR